MYIYGFPIINKEEWLSDPFAEVGQTPENSISEACHIYIGVDGKEYIGFNWELGLTETTMISYLSPFSTDLSTRKVVDP